MREKKFRYTFKHVETGNIEQKIYTLSQLEERNAKELSPCFNAEFGYELIGRDDFTGLKDKNGKEIYEGDILKTPSVSGKGDIITTIEWSEFSWKEKLIYSPIHQFYEYFDFSDETGEDSEVIGNIYENPELLEETA